MTFDEGQYFRGRHSVGPTYAGPADIGCKYTGPAFDQPSLRRLPPGWLLEETRQDRRTAAWYQVRRWLWIAFLAALALGYVAAVRAVLT